MQLINLPQMGAEDVVVDHNGDVWTGTEDGTIFRVAPDGSRIEAIANTGGRPLGLELLGEELLICDAHKGLLVLDPATGGIRELLSRIDGTPMVFCNNAAVASNGDIWFSDSSTIHPIERWKNDMVEATCTGRLFRLRDGKVDTIGTGLEFANGVALSADESFVVVAETGGRRLRKYPTDATGPTTAATFAADLSAYPDNIARGSDGLVWVALASPKDPVVELIKQRTPLALRRVVTKLPEAVQPAPKRTVRAAAYDANGRLVHDVNLDAAAFHMVTGVREHHGDLWLGSLHEAAIARVELSGN
ncbi:MAG TPA: SMP-30/gluconolactonase/LRE family protein [Marmoricola sp.]|nr:SMP-30/gluconolactonase/LRE family protein [Marmoricola sp.]HNO39999.1 SMP-30/gluconolactonase/LRE family protein [Marmoricola sp.]